MSGAAARASQLVTIAIPARAGEVSRAWWGYGGPPRANVLLPDGYRPTRAYPLLVLLHGLESDYGWYVASGVLRQLAGLHAIVVMPEGASGWYTDWWNNGERGNPSWESYELNEVLPAVLARYRILPQRRYHAIAGISMGGLGATYLGGRVPGFFGSVGTLSGFVDPQLYGLLVSLVEPLTSLAPVKGDLYLNAVEGPPTGFYATGHDPTMLADNLRATRVFQATGTGEPTSAELNLAGVEGMLLEAGVIYPMNRAYHRALVAAGVDSVYQEHPGGHDIPNFANELAALRAWNPFKPVAEHPRNWTNLTVATSGQLWDVGYRFASPPTAVVSFTRTGRRLHMTAAGSPVILTVANRCVIPTATPATVTVPRLCENSAR